MAWRPWLLNRVTITFGLIALATVLWNLYVFANDDGVLSGVVVGPDDQPVQGAKVVLFERTIVSLEPIAEAVTGADGGFRFESHDRHHVILTAQADGVGESGRIEVRLYFRNQNRHLAEPVRLAR
jgi:hypothetical protein